MTGNSGGPMTVAKPGSNRSHDRGRRHCAVGQSREFSSQQTALGIRLIRAAGVRAVNRADESLGARWKHRWRDVPSKHGFVADPVRARARLTRSRWASTYPSRFSR